MGEVTEIELRLGNFILCPITANNRADYRKKIFFANHTY